MRTFQMEKATEEVFRNCKKALSELKFSIEKEDEKAGELIAVSTVSLLSFGNRVTIQLMADQGYTNVSLNSQSLAAIQLIDWGVNSDLEQQLEESILQISVA